MTNDTKHPQTEGRGPGSGSDHTPTPWRVNEDTIEHNGTFVGYTDYMTIEDAEFIVRAVNSYEGNLAEIERLRNAPCAHKFVEAENYGQERDNVECRKCGEFWRRVDRVNAHDELVRRVEILGRMLEKATGWTLTEIAEQVTALAKAKGE